MRPLTGIDSMFLSMESPTNLFHVGAVSGTDPSTAPPGSPPPCEALRTVVANRLDQLPPFHRSLATVPAGLDHPKWVEDVPDLDRHVRRGAVPDPGGVKELSEYAADMLSRPLDRSRPLWEIHVVEGLEGGLVAGVAKIHHSAVDGIAGTEVTGLLMDLSPELVEPEDAGALPSERVPGPLSLLRDAVTAAPRRIIPAVRMLGRLTGTAVTLGVRNRQLAVAPPPSLFHAPRTLLAAKVGSQRTVGLAQVDRADVDTVRRATNVTVNDVILGLTSSALRTYFSERGELPQEPLAGFVPVSVRSRSDDLSTGVNRLSGMLVSLATDCRHPLARLVAVADSARAAKEQHRVMGEDMLTELAGLAVPALLRPAMRLGRAIGFTTRFPPFTVVVSSFPGPDVPLYCGGAELVAYHPFGPVIDGAALNVTAMSYRDQIGFGLLGCRDAVPDIDLIAHAIPEAMSEMVKAI